MILFFDHPHADAASARAAVGGKGASLWAMTTMGLPVPPGFTVPIATAMALCDDDPAFEVALDVALARLERLAGRRLGDPRDPLLLSVRSGAARSMPGMMDTLLNLGALADAPDDFGRELRRRFEEQAAAIMPELLALTDPRAQLSAAIRAVARSWHGPRARQYRAHAGIGDDGGTAVTVQAMVFGNRCDRSATGVAFSRCPTTGAPGHRGDILFRAQGEEAVAGLRTPEPLAALSERLPDAAARLAAAIDALEARERDLVDVEFTIESGRLWVLQSRAGKRNAAAAARIAVDLTRHPTIMLTRVEAVARAGAAIAGPPLLTRAAAAVALTRGLPASAGLASGAIALTPDAAIDRADAGPVVLVRAETSPQDVHGMSVAAGILTSLGGPMSHAALVAREWGLPAVVGCADVRFGDGGVRIGGRWFAEGDTISIDGATGEVFAGVVGGEVVEDAYAATLRRWARDLAGEAA